MIGLGSDKKLDNIEYREQKFAEKENIHSERKQKKTLRGKTLREGIIVWKGGRTLKVNMRSSDLKINM